MFVLQPVPQQRLIGRRDVHAHIVSVYEALSGPLTSSKDYTCQNPLWAQDPVAARHKQAHLAKLAIRRIMRRRSVRSAPDNAAALANSTSVATK